MLQIFSEFERKNRTKCHRSEIDHIFLLISSKLQKDMDEHISKLLVDREVETSVAFVADFSGV